MENLSQFFSIATTIFFVFNAIGQTPVFLAVLASFTPAHQRRIIIRELIIAFVVLLAFVFFGDDILKTLRITTPTIGLGGGFLLMLISLNLIFPKDTGEIKALKKEPLIIPLAIPGLAGPGSIAAMMIFSTQYGKIITASALFVAWLPSLILILLSSYVKKYLGEKGMEAVEKMGGMLIFLIGVEMISNGVIQLVKTNF